MLPLVCTLSSTVTHFIIHSNFKREKKNTKKCIALPSNSTTAVVNWHPNAYGILVLTLKSNSRPIQFVQIKRNSN